MKRLFGSLVTETCDSVEKRISVEKLAGSILALGAYEPAIGDRHLQLLDEHREEITSTKSVSKIFIILSPYWNYLDFEILVYIINHYGTHGDDSDEKRLQNYEKALKRFCKRRIFELSLPESGNGTDNKKQEKLYVKLNIREDAQAEQMFLIKRKVAEILQLNPATLQIYSVDEGCVQLIFLIPKFVAREIFPLSAEQATALSKDVAVIKLECGHYVFEVQLQYCYITANKDRQFQSLSGYPGCKQADETVVMRSLFWYYSLNRTADNLLNICEGGTTTTLQEYDAFDKAGDSIRDVQWLL